MPQISIIILNYNGQAFLGDCLDAVLRQTYQDFEIIFVDNASRDGSLEFIKAQYGDQIKVKKIILVENTNNDGFAEGNNIGVSNASKDSKYFWLLNNDTIADENALQNLVEVIESDDKIGAIGSLVLDKGQEDQINDLYFRENKKLGFSKMGEHVYGESSTLERESKEFDTSILSGCSLLYRKNLVAKPFPSFYFAYGEDVWFSWFALLRGYRLIFCANSIVKHVGGGTKKSDKKLSQYALFHGVKNQYINFLVFFSIRTTIKLLPLFLITQLGKILFRPSLIYTQLRGFLWIIMNFSKVKELRRYTQRDPRISEDQFLSMLSSKMRDAPISGISEMQSKSINYINRFFCAYSKIMRIPSND